MSCTLLGRTGVADGLDEQGVAERRRRGQVNDVPLSATRSVGDIVRANVFTPINALGGAMLVAILAVAPPQDALFGLVLVVNTAIGIVQELRAKRTLDRLAVLAAPRARVVRGGRVADLPVAEVVLDDVLEVGRGDQVVVDGEVLASQGLEIDESLLTGETEPVAKALGAAVLSGSFVAAGSGRYVATRVGADAYASRLSEDARRFTLVDSALLGGVNRVLRGLAWLLPPTAVALFASQIALHPTLSEAIQVSIAGLDGLLPEGLVLIVGVAFALSVIRLGRRRVLVQELPAVEGLARVDVLCLDKTGTLTEGGLVVTEVERLGEGDPAAALGAVAAADERPNATLRAVAEAFPSPDWRVAAAVPFSSARRWSAASFVGGDTWVLGAPEAVAGTDPEVLARAEYLAGQGRRVLMLGRSPRPVTSEGLPSGVVPVALVALGDRVRDEAAATVRHFAEEGVAIKVISGDHPAAVAAIARQVGIAGADDVVDGRQLPTEPEALADLVEQRSVFGRITPEQKREMVRALRGRGHVVAMTGDGVNDVPALKDADLGIAMGSGSQASRGVAQLVLLDDALATLPPVLREGRRVLANVERVAHLFLTKTAYAYGLALATAAGAFSYPLLPRQSSLVNALTIGVPAFLLALAPNAPRPRQGFVGRVLRASIPRGLLIAVAVYAAHAQAIVLGSDPSQARTVATVTLAVLGLATLFDVARSAGQRALRTLLPVVMAAGLAVALAVEPVRTFYALQAPPAEAAAGAVLLAGVAGGVLASGIWRRAWESVWNRIGAFVAAPRLPRIRVPQLSLGRIVRTAAMWTAVVSGATVAAVTAVLGAGPARTEQRFVTPVGEPVNRVVVDVDAGSVELIGTGGDQVDFTVTQAGAWLASPTAEHELRDGVLRLRGGCEGRLAMLCRTEYKVALPAWAEVEVETGGGNLAARGLRGPASLRTRVGAVTATTWGSEVEAVTGTGSVEVQAMRAPLRLSARSTIGDVTVTVPDRPYRVDATIRRGPLDVDVRDDPASERTLSASADIGAVRLLRGPDG